MGNRYLVDVAFGCSNSLQRVQELAKASRYKLAARTSERRDFKRADQRDPRPAAPRLTRKRKAAELGPQRVVVYVTTVQLSIDDDSTRCGFLLEVRIQALGGATPTALRGRERGSIAAQAAGPCPPPESAGLRAIRSPITAPGCRPRHGAGPGQEWGNELRRSAAGRGNQP